MNTSRTNSSAKGEATLGAAERIAFRHEFVSEFNTHFKRLFRYLDRTSGDPELAADIAQEAFLRLYRRGTLPDAPAQWLISVAMNLLRNAKSKEARRARILTRGRARQAHSDPARSPIASAGANEERQRVRAALDRLPERECGLLLLRAEGYAYRDLAAALGLAEASVGTLLARAKARFRQAYKEASDAL